MSSLLDPGQRTGIVDLAQVSRADILQVGNKAALLGELLQAQLPAIKGLVVCADSCAGLRASREFSPELLAQLEERLDHVLAGSTAFAVRSSIVDLPGTRPPPLSQGQLALGQAHCEYYVPRDALPIAIIACASACLDATGAGGSAAILIHPMVNADISGVAFTGGISSGDPSDFLVESCWGLGRGLADGNTDPDRYQLDPNFKVQSRQRGRKQHKLDPQLAGTLVSVNETERLAWTLDTTQLERIGTLAKRCESVLGGVQDIEFSITSPGTDEEHIVLLQSSPVTAAKLQPESLPPGEWVIYLSQLENFSEPLTPLTEDLLGGALPGFARTIHGRVYLDLDKLSRRLPLRANKSELTQALLFEQELAKLPFSFGKFLRQTPLWLALSPWASVFWWRSRNLSKAHRERFWDYANSLANDKTLNARELLLQFARGRALFGAPWRTPFMLHASSARYLIHMAILHRLVKRWTKRELDEGTLQQLCTGNADTLSNDMVADIAALGRSVANVPELKQAFAEPIDVLTLHQLLNNHANPAFVSQFSAFVQRFGHRGTREIELASSRWLEQPNALLAMIGIQAKTKNTTDGYGLQLLARDDLHQAIRKPWQRKVIDHLLRRIRYYVSLREDARHYSARALYLVRQRLLDFEDRLMREKKLYQRGDLFFLSWSDLAYLENGQLSPADAATLILAAREQHVERCSGKPLRTLGYTLESAEIQNTAETPAPNLVTGRCAAPGNCEGIARVVLNEADLANFQPGEVLVLAFADPTMAAAVHAAGAVVCERGSYMSNLSTLAREWGVPFVVSASNCTRAIATGERVSVQAIAGKVEILS